MTTPPKITGTDPRPGGRASDQLLRAVFWLALRLPYHARLRFMGAMVRRVIGRIAPWHTRTLAHLRLIWPELDASQHRAIARDSLDTIGRSFAETYSGEEFAARARKAPLVGAGAEIVRQALQNGRPLIIASAHFGNFEALRAGLAAQGKEIAMIYKPAQNRHFQSHYADALRTLGSEVYFKGSPGTQAFFDRVASGQPAMILHDVHHTKGPALPFLGHEAHTPTTAAWLAKSHGALLVPAYAIRQDDGVSFELVFEAPIPHGEENDMMLALNRSLEARISAQPGQWLWAHRRWR